jgi:DNA replication and repair protein RecF
VAATLDVWDGQLAAFGAEIVAARLLTLDALRPHLVEAYASIAPTNNVAGAEYKTSSLEAPVPEERLMEEGASRRVDTPTPPGVAELRQALTVRMLQRRNEEIARGVCLVGPHRDDITLSLGELPVKGYASHGESWSMALALRLASFQLLRADGVEPVLILDDVFAELDESRRARLAELVSDAEQVLVTAAVAADVPESLNGRRFSVQAATVTPEARASAPAAEGPDD